MKFVSQTVSLEKGQYRLLQAPSRQFHCCPLGVLDSPPDEPALMSPRTYIKWTTPGHFVSYCCCWNELTLTWHWIFSDLFFVKQYFLKLHILMKVTEQNHEFVQHRSYATHHSNNSVTHHTRQSAFTSSAFGAWVITTLLPVQRAALLIIPRLTLVFRVQWWVRECENESERGGYMGVCVCVSSLGIWLNEN